jgi:hypothetical protein
VLQVADHAHDSQPRHVAARDANLLADRIAACEVCAYQSFVDHDDRLRLLAILSGEAAPTAHGNLQEFEEAGTHRVAADIVRLRAWNGVASLNLQALVASCLGRQLRCQRHRLHSGLPLELLQQAIVSLSALHVGGITKYGKGRARRQDPVGIKTQRRRSHAQCAGHQ